MCLYFVELKIWDVYPESEFCRLWSSGQKDFKSRGIRTKNLGFFNWFCRLLISMRVFILINTLLNSFYDLGGFKYNFLLNLKPYPVKCLLSGENHCVFDFTINLKSRNRTVKNSYGSATLLRHFLMLFTFFCTYWNCYVFHLWVVWFM